MKAEAKPQTMARVILVSSDYTTDQFDQIEDALRADGVQVQRFRSADDFYANSSAIAEADVVVGLSTLRLTKNLLVSAPKLRALISMVIGTDNYDVKTATELGIIVGIGQTQENCDGMAESAILLMLAAVYDLEGARNVLRNNQGRPTWPSARQLSGKTVGLIGFGQIAKGVAKRLETWGVRLQAYSPRLRAPLPFGVKVVDLDELLKTSDIVSIHATLNSETRGLLNAERLKLLKRDAILVNTARGAIVDEDALYRMARDGRIGRIALDVYAIQPLPADSPLRTLPNAILTPHMVGHTQETTASLPRMAIENVRRVLRGEPPEVVSNPEVIMNWQARFKGHATSTHA